MDRVQSQLAAYACELDYQALSPLAVHAAKVRIIDTFGALIGGFFGAPCVTARNLAAAMPDSNGATVIGTRAKTTLDMAAFVNGTTARFVEMNDIYELHNRPKARGGHPSDVLMPVFAVAEHAQANGREFITSAVLAYEVYMRVVDVTTLSNYDYANYVSLGVAAAAGKLLGLSQDQLSHCISIGVVPNNALGQGRSGHLSMWKVAASGQAGRAGVFAAQLARAGMEGPHLPFVGKAGWCRHVAHEQFTLGAMGGEATSFKILETLIKPRPARASTIASILAAEIAAPGLKNVDEVQHVTVEVYEQAKEGTEEHHWDPKSRETADHSIPYVVAAALMNGTVTLRSYDDANLWNPKLRGLISKIELVVNDEFTRFHQAVPKVHRSRVTVRMNNGEQLAGESGGGNNSLSGEKGEAMIAEKFHALTEDFLGSKRVRSILECLWNLEDQKNVAAIPAIFAVI